MKRFILISTFVIFAGQVNANLLYGDNYISPERYAVNEADMYIDYSKIPPAPELNVDNLDDMRFNAPNLVEKDIQIGADEPAEPEIKVNKSKKNKREKISNDEKYKKRLPYKFAKWWVEQRYKREEPHHGSLHEIKVQKRIDYERKVEEEKLKKLEAE